MGGVTCEYLSDFATSYVINNNFETMSQNIEYHAHGPAHFAFGGTGGPRAIAAAQVLKDEFGWTDSEIGSLSWAGHHALKNSFSRLFLNDYNRATNRLYGAKLPVMEKKFEYDWDKLNADDGAYVKTKDEYGGIVFEPSFDMLAEEAEKNGNSLKKQWVLFFFNIVATDETGSFYKKVYTQVENDNITGDELEALINVLVGSQQYEGDISTNGAPLDPVFWMLHGEVFRMLQRVYFEGALSDASFTTVSSQCPGHSAMGTNPWLAGYHFSNSGSSSSILVEELTNRELANFLNPMSYDFNDKFDFIYDAAEYEWCPEFNKAFSDFASSQKIKTKNAELHGNGMGGM